MKQLLRAISEDGSVFAGEIEYYDEDGNCRNITLITTAGGSPLWVDVVA
ncbi:hypothetical protein [Ruegeria sp.]